MTNDELYNKAYDAIMELFNDMSVSKAETKSNLNALIGEMQIMMEGLGNDDDLPLEAEIAFEDPVDPSDLDDDEDYDIDPADEDLLGF